MMEKIKIQKLLILLLKKNQLEKLMAGAGFGT